MKKDWAARDSDYSSIFLKSLGQVNWGVLNHSDLVEEYSTGQE